MLDPTMLRVVGQQCWASVCMGLNILMAPLSFLRLVEG